MARLLLQIQWGWPRKVLPSSYCEDLPTGSCASAVRFFFAPAAAVKIANTGAWAASMGLPTGPRGIHKGAGCDYLGSGCRFSRRLFGHSSGPHAQSGLKNLHLQQFSGCFRAELVVFSQLCLQEVTFSGRLQSVTRRKPPSKSDFQRAALTHWPSADCVQPATVGESAEVRRRPVASTCHCPAHCAVGSRLNPLLANCCQRPST